MQRKQKFLLQFVTCFNLTCIFWSSEKSFTSVLNSSETQTWSLLSQSSPCCRETEQFMLNCSGREWLQTWGSLEVKQRKWGPPHRPEAGEAEKCLCLWGNPLCLGLCRVSYKLPATERQREFQGEGPVCAKSQWVKGEAGLITLESEVNGREPEDPRLGRSWIGRALRCHVRTLLSELIYHWRSWHNWICVVAF